MRPTDENQHSTRPNLMSAPRRGGNEESILEMLERDTERSRGRRAQSRFGWYVSATVCAVFLVSLLAWLAKDSPKVQQMEAVLAAADTAHPAPAHPSLDSGGAAEVPPVARAPIASSRAAIVDDETPPSRSRDAQQHLPPIELARPGLFDPIPGTQSTAGTAAPVQGEAKAASPSVAEAVPPASGVDGQHAGNQADASAARKLAGASVRSSIKPASPGSRAKPRKPAHAAGKAKRATTASAEMPDTQPDSDVALISAVIQHATNRPEPACADAECAAKATPRP